MHWCYKQCVHPYPRFREGGLAPEAPGPQILQRYLHAGQYGSLLNDRWGDT